MHNAFRTSGTHVQIHSALLSSMSHTIQVTVEFVVCCQLVCSDFHMCPDTRKEQIKTWQPVLKHFVKHVQQEVLGTAAAPLRRLQMKCCTLFIMFTLLTVCPDTRKEQRKTCCSSQLVGAGTLSITRTCQLVLHYRSLAKHCMAWVRILWEGYLEIAERSWVLSPQMIAPSGTVFSKATVHWRVKNQGLHVAPFAGTGTQILSMLCSSHRVVEQGPC
jgi:hypothetical protein